MRRSTLFIGAGASVLVAGAALLATPWIQATRWQGSPQAAQAERNAAAPLVVTPRATAVVVVRPTPLPTTVAAANAPTAAPTAPPADPGAMPTEAPPPVVAVLPTPTLGPSDLQLSNAAFQFLDPPQPGATARLSLSIQNPTNGPSGAVTVELPLAWLKGYSIEGVVPLPTDGRIDGEPVGDSLRLTVDGPSAGDALEVSVFVVTTEEVIDAPDLRAIDADGRLIGKAHPPTEAPPAQPGPVYALDIPSLHLHTGVVPVDWEPPLFVVGQLRDSAFVTEGNSVLVGHVRGAAGYNVFDRLDKVSVGDQIVANSRGEDYPFVVTRTEVLPADDTSPTQPSSTPRLTLMTCSGTFNPLTGEYSDRLWVIAEPADVARDPTPPPVIGTLGSTDASLADVFGAPVGEASGMAVYRRAGLAHDARFMDMPNGSERRSIVLTEHATSGTTWSMDDAKRRARALIPNDAASLSPMADGNSQFAVEYFRSAALERSLPAAWFSDRNGQPGELVAVYKLDKTGRVSEVIVSIGDDPAALLK